MSFGVIAFGPVILKEGCGRKGRRARLATVNRGTKENMKNCEQYRHINRYVEQIRKREAVGSMIPKGGLWPDHEELRMSRLGV